MLVFSNNAINNNYKQNFTAVRFPKKEQIIMEMGEDLGTSFLELKPDIEEVSNETNTDFEITFDSYGYLNVYAGKMLKEPWQTKHDDLPKYIKPNRGAWVRTDYNLNREARIVPDTIEYRCYMLADMYHQNEASDSIKDVRLYENYL